jgi:hypothetical protein
MLKYNPSMVAASAVYVAFHVLKKKINWSQCMAASTQYSESAIRSCSKDLCILFHGINKINLQAVKKKFSSSKFNKVGLITLEVKDKDTRSPEEKCNLPPPKDSFDEAEIPDEGERATHFTTEL